MKSIIRFFIQNTLLVNLGIALALIVGLIALGNMNSSFFPVEDENTIIIEAIYPGASPSEVEEGIVLKIEDNLTGVSGIDRVTSVSTENTTTITIELVTGEDADLVLQDVKNAVDQISNFPEDMERLVTYVRENINFTGQLALVGNVPLETLKERAKALEDQLRASPNLSKIELYGFPAQEIEIEIKEAALRSYNLTFKDVANAIQRENIQLTGGTIKKNQEVLIRSNLRNYTADYLGDIPVKTRDDGSVITLEHVATIHESWAEASNKAFFNGDPAVLVTVNTLNQENILDAADEIASVVSAFNASNTVVQAEVVRDGTQTLKERIALLEKNGIVGVLLVFVLLALFLRVRLALWVAAGIPISFLGMFIIANLAGITINVLSLFGMILVIGILVDDGIVVGENIFQHYEKGASKFKAVFHGTLEVIPSILSAIATTCLAFSFFFFIDGRLGTFFGDVAFVVIAALLFSLIEVMLFLPAHLAHIKDLDEFNEPNKLKVKVEQLLLKFRDVFFSPILRFALNYKLFSVLFALGLMVLTIGSIKNGVIKTTFFPNIEQTQIQATLEFKSGTAEHITEKWIKEIEKAALALNEKYIDSLGQDIIQNRQLKLGPGTNKATATFYLSPSEERSLRSFDVASDLRNQVGAVPSAEQLSFESATPFGKPLNVSFSAQNYERIRAAVEDFKVVVSKTGLVKDVITNDRADQPELNVEVNAAGRSLGLTSRDVITQVRNGFFGFEAQRLQRGDDEVKVWVRYELSNRNELEDLYNMQIRTPSGIAVPVNEIATITPMNGLIAINHLDGKKQISVQGELASFDITSTEMIKSVSSDVIPLVQRRFPDVQIMLDGQQRETAKIQRSVATAGPIILILMISLLIVTFRSISQAIALLMLVPFGLVGAGWGHALHGMPMSLLSFLGFIALMGVIINDGLVFVAAFNTNLKDGLKFNDALYEAALSRFRPIFLTTITTSAGLAPLILEKSFQAQFLVPMAITIAYGLLVGSFMLTVMLPVFLSLVNRVKQYVIWLWTGKKPSPEEIEKAIIRKRNQTEFDEVPH